MSQVSLIELDLSKLAIVKVGRNITLLYNKKPLLLVTGQMYMPFGVKLINNTWSSYPNCVIDCSLNQSNNDSSIKQREAIEALDVRIKELLNESVYLFTNEDIEVTDDNYYSILRPNKTYPKLMKFNIPRDSNGNLITVIFDSNKEKIVLDDSNIENVLPRSIVFKGIIRCNKIWYSKSCKFGIDWNLDQMILNKKEVQHSQPPNKEFEQLMID